MVGANYAKFKKAPDLTKVGTLFISVYERDRWLVEVK